MTTVFTNGRVFRAQDTEDQFATTIVISDHQILHVGQESDDNVIEAQKSGSTVDLKGKLVLPGFIDAHVHILNFGLSLQKLDLLYCKSLDDIRNKIQEYASTNPQEPRILCRGWTQSTTEGRTVAAELDDLDDRPIYIEALDLHSTWCNTASLEELQLDPEDPPGGTIHRYPSGQPSGLLDEGAQFNIIWPFLDKVASEEKRLTAMHAAFTAHRRAGYTGLVDMAMDENKWADLQAYRREYGEPPFHIAAHWLIPYSHDDSEISGHIDRAISLHKEFNRTNSPSICINGIKLICDGTVDGCTAGLLQPYGGLPGLIDPIWPKEALSLAINKATEAGLQCALHAIGDRTVQEAIDCLSQLPNLRQCRHRIEHLELTTEEDAKRLGDLGIIASVQPVHSDPATFDAWPSLIGEDRCKRAFAYREFSEGGAPLAFGTDAPTARHLPLPNLYNATTRRSALDPTLTDTVNAQFALPLATAISAATTGAAFASFADTWTGSLQAGLQADFVILDMHWMPDKLLEAKVCQTWYKGKKVFDEDEEE